MAHRFYVNLPDDEKKHYGRSVKLTVKISETKPGSSDGQFVYFFIKFDASKVVPVKWLPGGTRVSGFHFKPPTRQLAEIKGGKATAVAKISIGALDKFEFLAGKKADKSDAGSHGHSEVEVWRKVFVRMGAMKGIPTVGLDGLKAALDAVGIDLDTENARINVAHAPFTRGPDAMVALMNRGKAPPEFPDATVNVVCCDRIAEPKEYRIRHRILPGDVTGDYKFDIELKDEITWPIDADWIVKGTIKRFNDKNELRQTIADPKDWLKKSIMSSYYKPHPEGVACDTVEVDLSNYGPSLDNWRQRNVGCLEVDVTIHVIARAANGSAMPTIPNIILASNDSYTSKPRPVAAVQATLLHELGHAFGMVLRQQPKFKEDSGKEDGVEANDLWYTDINGGRGNHCHEGAKLDRKKIYQNGTCIMFHTNAPTRGSTFCARCTDILKRASLKKLGRLNVWNPKYWNA